MTESFEGRRKHPRYPLDKHVHVVDRQTGKSLGRIVNVSQGGMMLVDSAALQEERIYQLVIELDPGVIGNTDTCTIELGVDCLWNSPAATEKAAVYWSGCEIIDISDNNLELLERLIATVSEAGSP